MMMRARAMQPRRKLSLLIVLLAGLMVSVCGRETSITTPTSPSPLVVSVAISGTVAPDADTSQLNATAKLSDGTTRDVTRSAQWVSSNPEVATVSDAGLVTATGTGTATIRATVDGQSDTLAVIYRLHPVRRPGTSTSSPFSYLTGTWKGTWTDTRYNVSGSLEATFTVSGSTVTATGVIGLENLGLGKETGSGTGTVSGQTLNFTFTSNTVGNGSGSLSSGGAGSGSGTVTGVLNFGAFTYTGNVTQTEISGTFEFTSATGGYGVAILTRQ